MSGDKINLRIERKDGITQALKRLVEEAGDKVKNSVWNDTINKLEEINAQRQAENDNSIFSGGTQRSDWPHNFVVHEGNIEFTKDEMSALCEVMQISAEAKAKILNTETAPPTQKSPDEEATKLGYRKTNHSGTYYDEKTKTHYQWDEEKQTFIVRKDIKEINQDGSYYGTDNKEYNADGTPKNATSTETREENTATGDVEETQDTENNVKTTPQTPPNTTLAKRQAIEKSITDSIEGAEIEITQIDESGRPTKGTFKKGVLESGSFKTQAKDFTITYKDDGWYEVKINIANENDSCTITYNANHKKEGFAATINNQTVKRSYTYDVNGNMTTAIEEGYNNNEISWTEEAKYDSLERTIEFTKKTYNDNEINSQYTDKYTYLTDTKDSPCKFERAGFNSTGSYTQIGQIESKDGYIRNAIRTNTPKDGTISYETYVDLSLDMSNYVGLATPEIETDSLEKAKEYEQQLLNLKNIYHELCNEECSEATKEKYKSELINVIKDENTDIKVRQAAVFVANYSLSGNNKEIMDEIINTKNSQLIGCCLCGNDSYMPTNSYSKEQLDKIHELAVNQQFTDVEYNENWDNSGLLPDIIKGLISYGTEEQRFRAFNEFHSQVSETYPNLSLEFIRDNWTKIPKDCKLKMLANTIVLMHNGNAVGTVLEKEAFENFILPLLPQPPTEDDVNLLKEAMRRTLSAENRASYHLIESGDRFHNIIANYMMEHLEETFPKVAEKTDWTTERKREAVNKYVKEFGVQIAKNVGLNNPNKIYPGQIIDFSKIEWKEPNMLNWWFWY